MRRLNKMPYFPNIEAELARRGLNAKDLGVYMKMTSANVRKKLNGECRINTNDMEKIVAFFNDDSLTLDYLFKINKDN